MTLQRPDDEVERLVSLPGYDVMGTAPEAEFDEVTRLASTLLGVPIALVSIVGKDEQWLKSRTGLAVESTPRDISFCTHTILTDAPLVVLDALRDARFADNPLVTGAPHIRFYAGAPLFSATGVRLGALCVIDVVARERFSAADEALLVGLAGIVSTSLEKRRAARQLHAVANFAAASAIAVITGDRHGRITYWNASAERMFGHMARDVLGHPLDIIIPPRFRGAHNQGVRRLNHGQPPRLHRKPVDVVALHADGHEFPVELTLATWVGPKGLEVGAHAQDVTVRKAHEATLEHLAERDPLTGLFNPRAFRSRLAAQLTERQSATILVADLDGFKKVNDTLGHLIGEALLQSVSVRMMKCIDDGWTLARIGGDEFAILLPVDLGLFEARDAAARLVVAMGETFLIADHRLTLAVSVGVALAPAHAREADDLLAKADAALLAAKRDGGSAYRLFDATMASQLEAQRMFKEELRQAALHQQWELHYQPQVRFDDGCLMGVEALLRWRHPERGLLYPAAFMAVLETHMVAFDVGCWVLDEALRQLAVWRRAGVPVPRVSVNLFAAQLHAGDLDEVCTEALRRHGLVPADLEVEITETIALRYDEDALAPLFALMNAGVGIALDDFGTGYASLTTLKMFPLTCLKIDRSFVQDIEGDPHNVAVVRAILVIAETLGIEVVAEGIEREEQQNRLLALGCSQGQGYLYPDDAYNDRRTPRQIAA